MLKSLDKAEIGPKSKISLAPTQTTTSTIKTALFFGLVAGLTAYPALLSWLTQGKNAAFKYFAADAFYYLGVADRSANTGFYTFDGSRATNGFHPLWQYYLTGAFKWLNLGDNQDNQILFTFFSSLVLVAIGTGLFGLALLRLTGSPALTLLATLPGPYYLLFSNVDRQYSAPWSYINGMESPFSIFFFGLLGYGLVNLNWLARRSYPAILATSALLTALAFSRLDDIFIFGPFLLLVAFSAANWAERVKHLLAAVAFPTVVFSGYLLYNLATVGSALPLSGVAKAGLAVTDNLRSLIGSFIPLLQIPNDPSQSFVWESETWRALQICIPGGVAALALVYFTRGRKLWPSSSEQTQAAYVPTVLWFFSLYAVLKSLYNFVLVPLWHQGHWYFPLNIFVFNLLLIVYLQRLVVSKNLFSVRLKYWPMLVCLGIVLINANAFADQKRTTSYNEDFAYLWAERARITQDLKPVVTGGFLEFDDGVIAYSTNLPAMSGLGFALDKEGFEAKKRGELLDLAYRRGFRSFASLVYLKLPPTALTNPAALREALSTALVLEGQKLDGWDFKLAYKDPKSNLIFISFAPNGK